MTAKIEHIKYLKLLGYAALAVAALNTVLVPLYLPEAHSGAGFADVATAFIGGVAVLIAGALQRIEERLKRLESND